AGMIDGARDQHPSPTRRSSDLLSAGATRPGICVDVAGTASVFATTTTEMVNDMERKTLACGQSVIKGLWHPYAYLNGGGMNIERSEEHTSELQSRENLVCRLLL